MYCLGRTRMIDEGELNCLGITRMIDERERALHEGWEIIQTGITKMMDNLEAGVPRSPTDRDCYAKLYTTVFRMCGLEPPQDHYEQFYERYEGVYKKYLQSNVLPAIQDKHDDDVSMLQELVKRWENHKVMVRILRRCFVYLDHSYIPERSLPTLKDVGFGCFRKIVFEEMKVRVKDAVISLINQERGGEEIDRALLKNVLEILVALGNKDDAQNMDSPTTPAYRPTGTPVYAPTCLPSYSPTSSPSFIPTSQENHSPLVYYVNDFETAFLDDTADYYTRKASNWTKEDCAVKAKLECLLKEKDRVSHYLHPSTIEKLLTRVRDVLNAPQAIA